MCSPVPRFILLDPQRPVILFLAMPPPVLTTPRHQRPPETIPRPTLSASTIPPSKNLKGILEVPETVPSLLAAPAEPSKAPSGAKDWANHGNGDIPSSITLLTEWLSLGDHFLCFKFGAKGTRQAQAAKQCEDWLRARNCPSPLSAETIQKCCNNE